MKGSLREKLLGDYNYGYLCKPRWPFCRSEPSRPPPFYGRDAALGLVTSSLMGLQHALAMVGGLVTPPLLVGLMAPDQYTRTYLIQASLLICGFMTFIQVTGIKVPRLGLQWGSGLLSVMGVSFATVPVATKVVGSLMAQGLTFDQAFGKLLGTAAVCAVWPILLSFLPYKLLKRIFPPIVTGVTITLIGVNLVAVGFKYWGGGAFCAENYNHLPTVYENCTIPSPDGGSITAACYNADIKALCTDNGDVQLPYGSAPYIGMGFLVFGLIVVIELFGSPFMRNASLVLSLLVGYMVSALVKVGGNSFVTLDIINASPIFTFLWVNTFPVGFYAPAILPLLIVFCITSVETVGDVTATAELSSISVDGPDHVMRIRGGILNDGISGIISALATSLPLTTFAQNNGVIALTSVASRSAGWAAACWLLLFGVLGKVGGWVLSIPHCVLGGATSFLFASVITSGIKILMMEDGLHRRSRFIVACSLALGLGVSMVPQWAHNNLWPVPEDGSMSPGLQGLRTAIMLILETGFCVGALTAFALNMALPLELDQASGDPTVHPGHKMSGLSLTTTDSDVKGLEAEAPSHLTMTADTFKPAGTNHA